MNNSMKNSIEYQGLQTKYVVSAAVKEIFKAGIFGMQQKMRQVLGLED